MKIGMNMLLWTGHIGPEHVSILQAIKDTGFDGVEVPVFDPSDAGHFRWLAGVYFAWVFVVRGFGVAVGTHTAYDILVGWLDWHF